ncbi:MAG: hypothetical protein M3R08_12010 [Bacteroidota bacterium]|nr:hypothetical protein [Bacteroidota bacterium]
MEYISDRVSIDRNSDRLSVVISPRLSSGKRSLLITWVIAWTLIGIYVIHQRNQLPAGDPLRQYLLAFLAFWAYFEIRVGRALLWRLKGFELWRVKEDVLTIKDSILGFGGANKYFIQNIQKLGLIEIDESSWKWQMNESVWVMGGERIGFEHLGKKVAFGKGLTPGEARQLVIVLKGTIKKSRVKEA